MSEREESVIAITKDLIGFDSVTPDSGDCIGYIKEKLEQIGFDCILKEFQSENSDYKTPNLYAKLGGKIGDKTENLCFAGHTDVVPTGPLDLWSNPPFIATEKDGFLYGRGASDMKGAIACFMAACQGLDIDINALKSSGKSISLLITGDEEGHAIDGTKRMLEFLRQEYDEKITIAIVGEASCSNTLGDAIKVGRRGSMTINLEIKGRQGHTAYPEKALNPINDMVNVLSDIKSLKLDDGDEYFAPSHLVITSVDVGNFASNIIPESAKAVINIRFNTNHNFQSLKQIIMDTCLKYVKGSNLNISTLEGAKPFMGIKEDNEFLRKFMKIVHDVTNQTPDLNTKGGTSDARFICDYAPVFEFGVPNKTIHKIDENVSINDLLNLENIYSEFIKYFVNNKI